MEKSIIIATEVTLNGHPDDMAELENEALAHFANELEGQLLSPDSPNATGEDWLGEAKIEFCGSWPQEDPPWHRKPCLTPTIHLNGTAKQDLLEERYEAIRACAALREALAKAAPNARDYYPQGPHAHRLASVVWGARLGEVGKLEKLLTDEVEEIIEVFGP